MKHAVKQRKSAVEPKTKSLAPVKTVTKNNLTAKKSTGKVAAKSRTTKPVQKTKVAVKAAPKTAKAAAKTSLKKTAPKLSAKTLNALKTVSNRKAKPVVKLIEKPKTTKSIASKLPAKSAKVSASKTAVKKSKLTVQKPAPISKSKKATAEKKIVKPLAKQKLPLKNASAKPKKAVKIVAKAAVKPLKLKATKTPVESTVKKVKQPVLPKAKVSATAKKNVVSQKSKPAVQTKKSPKNVKAKLIQAKPIKTKKIVTSPVTPKTIRRKTEKITIVAPKKIVKKTSAAKIIVQPKKVAAKKVPVKAVKTKIVAEPKKVAAEIVEFTPISASENVVWKRLKIKPAISSAKAVKARQKAKKEAVVETIKPAEIVQEIKKRTPKTKRGKPIGSAVFRGKKERYDFKVFELDDVFEPIPAVYIISKRKTDRHKRSHHALICIGATDSISDELKRHRKGKCVKKHSANVVSILPETDEKMRFKIETDLKAAHHVACNFE